MTTELPLDAEDEVYHVARASVRDFERITLMDVDFEPDLTRVTSKGNGAGKSSLINAVAAGLGGKKQLPRKPVHDGADEAVIELEVGPYIVRRTFSEGGSPTIELLHSADRAAVPDAARTLKDWRSDLTFDPLAFCDMTASKQRDELLAVLGLEEQVEKLDADRDRLFSSRTEKNRDVARLKGAVSEYEELTEAPKVPSTEVVIKQRKELEAQRDAHKQAHEAHVEAAAGVQNAQKSAAMLNEDAAEALVIAQAALAAAEKQVESAKAEGDGLVEMRTEELNAATAAVGEAPADPGDEAFAALDTQLTEAADKAADLSRWEQAVKVREELAEEKAAASELTEAIAKIDAEKLALIQGSALPLPELGIDEEGVTFGGIPFEQADDAQKLRVGFAVGMARKPKVPIALVRNGSQLDDANVEVMRELAQELGVQVILESLDRTGTVGVVIEDGRLAEASAE